MKRLIATVALLLMAPALALAQNADNPSRGQGYLFFAPVVTNHAGGGQNAGFGGELLFGHVGAGAELGLANASGLNVGIGSIDFSYHFPNKSMVEPFATGGASVFFGHRSTTMTTGFNLGGGINVWVAKHVAVRFEVRDYSGKGAVANELGLARFVAFRIGLTFR